MAYLLRRSGITSMLIQRAHYAVKKRLAYQQQLQFMWHQAWGTFILATVLMGDHFSIVQVSLYAVYYVITVSDFALFIW